VLVPCNPLVHIVIVEEGYKYNRILQNTPIFSNLHKL
jgi:hypothetical protein